jgi:hypothetical protein
VQAANDPAFGAAGSRLAEAVECLDRATRWLLAKLAHEPDTALAGATPYLRLFASAAGGCLLAEEALASMRLQGGDAAVDAPERIAVARFFAENLAIQAPGLERAVTEGSASIAAADAALVG